MVLHGCHLLSGSLTEGLFWWCRRFPADGVACPRERSPTEKHFTSVSLSSGSLFQSCLYFSLAVHPGWLPKALLPADLEVCRASCSSLTGRCWQHPRCWHTGDNGLFFIHKPCWRGSWDLVGFPETFAGTLCLAAGMTTRWGTSVKPKVHATTGEWHRWGRKQKDSCTPRKDYVGLPTAVPLSTAVIGTCSLQSLLSPGSTCCRTGQLIYYYYFLMS